jgi:Uma2 family endonuclease
MQGALKNESFSEADYLNWEQSQSTKHEYAGGQVFAMAGASKRHNTISLNVGIAFRQKAKDCTTFLADVKLKGDKVYYYPDVMLSYEPTTDSHIETQPCLVVEVLSDSTWQIDRVEKLHNYCKLASLQAYVLIEQDRQRVDVYRRHQNQWWYETYEAGGVIELPCLQTPLNLTEIYAGIKFVDPAPALRDAQS